jgi:glycosyltransferase involved in cell wall biosynthesis
MVHGKGRIQTLSGARPKVAFILQDLKYGGTQRQTLELVKGLDRARFKAQVWALAPGEDLVPLARDWGVDLVRLGGSGPGNSSLVGPLALARLWRAIQHGRADLLVLLTVVPNIWGRILGRTRAGQKIIGNCRNGAVWRQHERLLWPLADHLIANSEAVGGFVGQSYRLSQDRIRVILNGVDTGYFRPAGNPPEGGPTILSVARMVRDKDQATLISAFSRVVTKHPGARLLLVGEGPLKNRIRAQATKMLPPDSFSFPRTGTDIRGYYRQAQLVALSSVHESLPNVILEAMACGLPVVSTLVGGTDELIQEGQTGFLVRPRDPAALARALEKLIADPARQKEFGLAGRRRAREVFPLARMIQGHEDLFTRVLGRPLARGGQPLVLR